MRIRIRFKIQGFYDQYLKKLTVDKKFIFFSKIALCLSLGLQKRTSRPQEKPSDLKREQPAPKLGRGTLLHGGYLYFFSSSKMEQTLHSPSYGSQEPAHKEKI
jgi:hypothetical protein